MKHIRVSDLAWQDLDDLWYFIAKKSGSIEVADQLIESITEVFPFFAQAPGAGTMRHHLLF